MNGLGLVVLRLALAVVFVAHGAHKLFGLWAGPAIGVGGLDMTAQQFASLGLNPSFLLAVTVGVVETLGGLLLVVGWFTRFAAPAMGLVTLLTMWKGQWANGFFLNWTGLTDRGQGFEFSLILLGALLCLTFIGGGEWSLDGQREASRASRQAGRARLRGKF